MSQDTPPIPSAIKTEIGFARPSGEQLNVTKGLPSPVAYYKPNSGPLSFLDPNDPDQTGVLVVDVVGTRATFNLYLKEPADEILWDLQYGDAFTSKEARQVIDYPSMPIAVEFNASASVNGVPYDVNFWVGKTPISRTPPTVPAPTFTGTPVVGGNLAGTATAAPTGFTLQPLQWLKDGKPVASGGTLALSDDLYDSTIILRATYVNADGVLFVFDSSKVVIQGAVADLDDVVSETSDQLFGTSRLISAKATGYPIGSAWLMVTRDGDVIESSRRGPYPMDKIGASGFSYTNTVRDVGKNLQLIYTDANGDIGIISDMVTVLDPESETLVEKTPGKWHGTNEAGSTVTYTPGEWELDGETVVPELSIVWESDDGQILGVGRVFSPSYRDAGATVKGKVYAKAGDQVATGSTIDIGDVVSNPICENQPHIFGTAVVGDTLGLRPGDWFGYPDLVIANQWHRNGFAIEGEVATSYELKPIDSNAIISCLVTCTANGKTARTWAMERPKVDDYTGPTAAPVNLTPPSLSGVALVGNELTVVPGTWQGADSQQATVYRATTETGAGSPHTDMSKFTPDANLVGSYFYVEETAVNPAGNTSINGPRVRLEAPPASLTVPTISGTARVGQTLTATAGTWSGVPTPTYTYQWQRGTTNVAGGTNATYTAIAGDAGQTLRCVVTATNSHGSATANSAATALVTQTPAVTTAIALSGTAKVGETLTSTAGAFSGSPSPTVTRAWYITDTAGGALGTALAGQTGTTLVVPAAAEGKFIAAVATATNSAGNTTSRANSAVVAAADPAPEA